MNKYVTYTTVTGDTFDLLALAAYNEERLASIIIEANPDQAKTIIFEAGIVLKIPVLDEVSTPETLPPWRR